MHTEFPVDIILVTHRVADEKVIQEIEDNTPEPHRLISTCRIGQSASVNRNYGLEQSDSPVLIMMDDDIRGFYPGWLTDLVVPMVADPRIIISSIRCLDKDGKFGSMMGLAGIPDTLGVYDVQPSGYRGYQRVPTACVAIKKNAVRFDENFCGSGYEDLAWCNYVNMIYEGSRIVINNNCRLVHLNEMKNQGGKFWEWNKAYYLSLFPGDDSVRNQTDWTRG